MCGRDTYDVNRRRKGWRLYFSRNNMSMFKPPPVGAVWNMVANLQNKKERGEKSSGYHRGNLELNLTQLIPNVEKLLLKHQIYSSL
ncbi:hypothetical protein TNCV_522061 [Trichonephila clavipes]|nr:hypothetical protein TNCV_522061 [Trichonephila clavipes]